MSQAGATVTRMGLMDTVKGWFGGNKDKVKGGIDKTGDVVDDKTGGKFTGQVDTAQDTAKDAVDKIGDDQ
jgi:MT0933-like antitoxin protein